MTTKQTDKHKTSQQTIDLTDEQVESIRNLYERASDEAANLKEFTARFGQYSGGYIDGQWCGCRGTDGYIGGQWCGMFVGIEKDGYIHS
jgi:hypothetical protein